MRTRSHRRTQLETELARFRCKPTVSSAILILSLGLFVLINMLFVGGGGHFYNLFVLSPILGLNLWWLWNIGHDCCHNAFFSNIKLNVFVGHIVLIPCFTPFFGMKSMHGQHHRFLNDPNLDYAWVPYSVDQYQKLTKMQRLCYRVMRTRALFLGTMYITARSIADQFCDKESSWRAAALLPVAFAFLQVVFLGSQVGWPEAVGILSISHIVFHTIYAGITILQHFSDHGASNWSLDRQKAHTFTTDYKFNRLVQLAICNSNIHIAHHLNPRIPFYLLAKARRRLDEIFPSLPPCKNFSLAILRDFTRNCHLIDNKDHAFVAIAKK